MSAEAASLGVAVVVDPGLTATRPDGHRVALADTHEGSQRDHAVVRVCLGLVHARHFHPLVHGQLHLERVIFVNGICIQDRGDPIGSGLRRRELASVDVISASFVERHVLEDYDLAVAVISANFLGLFGEEIYFLCFYI